MWILRKETIRSVSTKLQPQDEQILDTLRPLFDETFGAGGDIRAYFSPGRVNLIGEHTDYNGGASMPAALTIGTYFLARKREDRKLRFYSKNFEDEGVIEGSLDDLVWSADASWTNYPKGVMWAFEQKGYEIPNGFDILLYGNIPNGSGLSSSASVEVGIGLMLKDMDGFGVSMEDLAYIGQFAENNFNKVNCGILDQFSIAMGKKDHAIFLRTAPLSYEYAPIDLGDIRLVIACSNKKRGLGDSKYNERRAECEQALSELQTVIDVSTLGDLTEAEFEAHADAIGSSVRRRRARHAVSENQRTIRAKDALDRGDVEEFGRLMCGSHASLRDDYEVTGPELDTLVDAAMEVEGVIGARMTGAGFGGCTVNLVREADVPEFVQHVGEKYRKTIGWDADIFPVEIGDGPRRLL